MMRRTYCRVIAVSTALACATGPATALEYSGEDWTLQLDTTVSVGALWRLQDPSAELIGLANGGQQFSVNADDGNLNYHRGWASVPVVISADLEISVRNFGGFFRANAFYDFENARSGRERTALSDAAKDQVARKFSMMDAYLWADFTVADKPLNLRLGRQVLNWGESTFIPNGINAINPVDVSKLRIPGAELRDALLPIWSASFSLGITDNITWEAFYQFAWKEIIVDPPGTYFSSNDFAGRGGERVYLGFGAIPDTSPLGYISRAPNNEPKDDGQFGTALRLFAPWLNNTEFGLFFIKYHSRLPVISARTPTTPINMGQSPMQVAFLMSAATGKYVVEYPEDIKLLGLSFNTDLGTTGVSLQGEISYKWDQPLQVDDVELLFAALSSINPVYGNFNQLGNYAGQLDTYVPGYIREEVWQGQVTATKVFGPTLGASQWVLLAEVGATHVPGLPDTDELRMDGPATFLGGNENATTVGLQPATEPASKFADRFSWGYRIVSRLDYNDLFWSVNAAPFVQFAHDVSGNTPLPLGTFQKDRKSVSLGVDFTYQYDWAINLTYTNYFGAGKYNLLKDRDFISMTLKYSF